MNSLYCSKTQLYWKLRCTSLNNLSLEKTNFKQKLNKNCKINLKITVYFILLIFLIFKHLVYVNLYIFKQRISLYNFLKSPNRHKSARDQLCQQSLNFIYSFMFVTTNRSFCDFNFCYQFVYLFAIFFETNFLRLVNVKYGFNSAFCLKI